jgi:Family of unknown function (DUF5681)
MKIGKPFQKGQSGNPGGRPKEIAKVKELAREHMPAAINALASIMNNTKASRDASGVDPRPTPSPPTSKTFVW